MAGPRITNVRSAASFPTRTNELDLFRAHRRKPMVKTNPVHFFEYFRLGQVIKHATPRTITAGINVLYTALYGSRFAVQSSDPFAQAIGYRRAPIDDLAVFHIVFGKSVPDISLNAVADLGSAACSLFAPVYRSVTHGARDEV